MLFPIRNNCRYIYSAQISLSVDNVVDVLVASRQFGLDALLQACMEHVSGSLDTDNVWSLLVMADIYDLPALKERCFRFNGTRASIVLKSEHALDVSGYGFCVKVDSFIPYLLFLKKLCAIYK